MTSDELSTARLMLADAAAAAAATRRTTRATSTPLLVLGVIGTLATSLQWAQAVATQHAGSSGRPSIFVDSFVDPTFLIEWATIVALGALAWREHQRWSRLGLAGVAGYGVAAVAFYVVGRLVLPLSYFGLAGPFLGLAIVLLLFGLRDHRPRLVTWTAVLATLGTAENYYAFTNRLPYTAWTDNLHYAIMVAIGVLFLAAGVIERGHENRS